MMQYDYTKQLAQQILTLTNKLEKLNARVKILESERQAASERDSRRSPGVSTLSADRVKQLKESVTKS